MIKSLNKPLVVRSQVELEDKRTSWVLYTLLLGGTVVSFSNSALNPAIPVFMSTFKVDIVTGSWVLNAYVLAMSIGLMLTGYLSHRFRQKHLYIFGIASFVLGSIIGAMAQNMGMVIIARAVQGFAGGIIIPLSIGMIYQLFPKPRHGRMMALWGIVIMMSLAFGPLVGAYLIDVFAWWALFISTVPLSVVVVIMAWRVIPESDASSALDNREQNQQLIQAFDWLGFISLLLWLLSFMWWVNHLDTDSSLGFIALSVIFVISALMWWAYEKPNHKIIKKSPKLPLLDLTLFDNPIYFHSNIISVTQTIALMLCLLLLPIIIQDIMKESALWTGLILMISTLIASVTTHFAGKIVDNQGARSIGIIGIMISTISTLLFAYILFKPTLLLISVLMIIRGVGVGLAYLPSMTVGFSSLTADKVTEGASLNNISRRIFSTILIVLASLYIDIRQKYLPNIEAADLTSLNSQSLQEVFAFTGLLLLITVYSALKLPKNINRNF